MSLLNSFGDSLMDKKLMDYNYLQSTERSTIQTTIEELPIWHSKSVEIIDMLFSINYYTGKEDNAETPEGTFHYVACSNYLRLPYTLSNIIDLIKKGAYLESTILIRHLYEILVQLRYFNVFKEKVHDYSIDKLRIQFKTMFDEICPELYTDVYKFFSNYSHGGLWANKFRVNNISKDEGFIYYGSDYIEKFALYVTAHQLFLSYGFMNYVPIFFKKYNELIPKDIESKRTILLNWLLESFETSYKEEYKNNGFYKNVVKLIK